MIKKKVCLPYKLLRGPGKDSTSAHAQELVLEPERELARGLVQQGLHGQDNRDCNIAAQADTDRVNSRGLGTYNKHLCKRGANQFSCP